MAATGFTPISLYYSATATNVPTSGNLVAGELAINTADGKLFYKDSSGVVQTIASKASTAVAGSTTQVIYNNAGAYAGSANFVFDGSKITVAGQMLSTATSGASFKNITPTTGNNYLWLGNTGNSLYAGKESSAGGTLFSDSSAYAAVFGNDGNYPVQFATNNIVRVTISNSGIFAFNSGYGSVANAYGCRAWVNLNGSDGSINGNGNVSSVTRNGTGDYTINLTTAMPDATYAITGSLKPTTGQAGNNARDVHVKYDSTPTTSSFRVNTATSSSGYEDPDKVYLAIFR